MKKGESIDFSADIESKFGFFSPEQRDNFQNVFNLALRVAKSDFSEILGQEERWMLLGASGSLPG